MSQTLSDCMLGLLSNALADQTGLHFPPERWPDLERGLAAAARELEFADAAVYARQLLSAVWTKGQIETLARHLTIGETYFFRHQESLAVLESHVLPELISARRQNGRYLRIWCAGCCTGEEPYSVAILLRRALPDWRDWGLTLLGTDINPHFLQRAQQGVYREWSFRETDSDFRRRYFTRTDQDDFLILSEIKAMVTFSNLNLARDYYPSPVNGTNAMDVILCRNVLMYFSAERSKEVLRGLHHSLVPGGWLIVSPSECSQTLLPEFAAVSFPGAMLYRKDSEAAKIQDQSEWPAADTNLPTMPAPEIVWAEALPKLPSESELKDFGGADDAAAAALLARQCANDGRLSEALEWGERAIAANKLNPGYHYLLGAILQEYGRLEEAAAALKRALYLDQDFVVAHFALGNLRKRQGRCREAERHFRNTLHVLRQCSPAEPLAESDGMSAERLAEIVQSMLQPAMVIKDR
jgi:chemotaxis protein methyltransferase CheR